MSQYFCFQTLVIHALFVFCFTYLPHSIFMIRDKIYFHDFRTWLESPRVTENNCANNFMGIQENGSIVSMLKSP